MGDKIGHGYIGSNKDAKSERHPAYKGKLTVDRDIPAGTTIWIAGWDKQNDRGRYISLNAEVSNEPGGERADVARQPAPPRKPASPQTAIDLNDDVPF